MEMSKRCSNIGSGTSKEQKPIIQQFAIDQRYVELHSPVCPPPGSPGVQWWDRWALVESKPKLQIVTISNIIMNVIHVPRARLPD